MNKILPPFLSALPQTSATVAELAKQAASMLDLPVAKTKIVCDGVGGMMVTD